MTSRLYVVAKIPKTVYDERVRIFKFLSTFIFVLLTFFIFTKNAFATITATYSPNPVYLDSGSIKITLTGDTAGTFKNKANYTFGFWSPGSDSKDGLRNTFAAIVKCDKDCETNKKLEYSLDIRGNTAEKGLWTYKVWLGQGAQDFKNDKMILPKQSTNLDGNHYYIYPPVGSGHGLPYLKAYDPVQFNTWVPLTVVNINPTQDYTIYFDGSKSTIQSGPFPPKDFPLGSLRTLRETGIDGQQHDFTSATIQVYSGNTGKKRVCLRPGKNSWIFGLDCEYSVEFTAIADDVPCAVENPPPPECPWRGSDLLPGVPDPVLIPSASPTPPPSGNLTYIAPLPPCTKWVFDFPKNDSNSRLNGDVIPDNSGYDAKFKDRRCIAVDTAIGEISTEPQGFVRRIFELVLGLAGGIALILIIISGYRFMVSQGNPEALKAATEQLTSAIVGLLFIILSFVILQVIGVDILRIPGFQP